MQYLAKYINIGTTFPGVDVEISPINSANKRSMPHVPCKGCFSKNTLMDGNRFLFGDDGIQKTFNSERGSGLYFKLSRWVRYVVHNYFDVLLSVFVNHEEISRAVMPIKQEKRALWWLYISGRGSGSFQLPSIGDGILTIKLISRTISVKGNF